MATAKIERYHGEPAIVVNGEAMPPLTMVPNFTTQYWGAPHGDDVNDRLELFKRYRDCGLRIFFVSCSTEWTQPERRDEMAKSPSNPG